MCFVWILEQTAIIYVYSINWLIFITETECLLRGTDWIFVCYLVRLQAPRRLSALREMEGAWRFRLAYL